MLFNHAHDVCLASTYILPFIHVSGFQVKKITHFFPVPDFGQNMLLELQWRQGTLQLMPPLSKNKNRIANLIAKRLALSSLNPKNRQLWLPLKQQQICPLPPPPASDELGNWKTYNRPIGRTAISCRLITVYPALGTWSEFMNYVPRVKRVHHNSIQNINILQGNLTKA